MELLYQRIERIAAEQPHRNALVEAGRSLTYGDMMERVRRLSSALAARGVAKGDGAIVALPDSLEFVLSHLALLRLGAVTVPVHSGQPLPDLASQVSRMFPRAIFTTANVLRSLGDSTSDALKISVGAAADGCVLFDELLAAQPDDTTVTEVNESDVAAVVWTAGVSGPPRPVELTHLNFAHQAHVVGRSLRLRPTDCASGTHAFASIFGLTLELHLPLAHGAAIRLFNAGSKLEHAAALHEHGITLFAGSPRTYVGWAGTEGTVQPDSGLVRFLICCGGRLESDARSVVLRKSKQTILCGYGATETCGLVTLNLFPDDEHPTDEGEPLGDAEIAILDEQGRRLGTGKVGRIAVRGSSVMRGYWKLPENTKDSLRDNWLMTDDLGELDYQSRLSVHGHPSERITKGGFPVYSWEVEEILRRHPGIKEAAVVGVADPAYGEELKACIVSNNGTMLAAGEILEYLKTRLPIYKCPRIIKFHKELPRTSGGKIKRVSLREDRIQ